MREKEYKFSGKIVRCVFNSDDFKIYAMDVSKEVYPDIKHNKYKNVSISGELPDLTEDVDYEVVATEQETKHGYGYKVINIKRDIPTTAEEMYLFLSEILTANQANVLYNVYPDIVQRVKENRLDDIDLNKLYGIKEYTFNNIKKKIIENFCIADLVIEFQGYLSLSVIKKIYKKYSSIELLRAKLKSNPYKCLCGIAGIGFKTADGILLDIEKVSNENIKNGKQPIVKFKNDLRTSCERCLACIMYILKENETQGHTKMNLAELRKACLQLVPECIDHFVTALKSDSIYYNKDQMDAALIRTYNIEHKIAETIVRNLSNKNVWEYDIKKYKIVNGVKLSDEQMLAVENVCKYPISILNGAAGTGKSFSTQAIINLLKDHNKTFRLFSPTGKAAKVLADYTKEIASTIHRGLEYSPSGRKVNYIDENGETRTKIVYWGYNEQEKLPIDILIIDEFSMVDIELFEKVINALDFRKTKLLLIGDNAQLPSVSCGNLLHDFMESGLIPTTTLNKVFRYSEGGLMKVATDVRFCKSYLDNSMKSQVTTFGNNKDYRFIDIPQESIPKQITALYKKLLNMGNNIENIQVLTAKNKGEYGTEALNNLIQQVANTEYGSQLHMKVGETVYYKNDLVIQKVNNYNALIDMDYLSEDERNSYIKTGTTPTAFVANGETGVVIEVCKDDHNCSLVIDFDGIKVRYDRSDMLQCGLGYAITIHKSQGSSIKNVILCTPKSHTFMLNSNLIYVGLTRMKEKCYHLGSLQCVDQAIGKKENLARHTFMKDFMLDIANKNSVYKHIEIDPEDDMPWFTDEELSKIL